MSGLGAWRRGQCCGKSPKSSACRQLGALGQACTGDGEAWRADPRVTSRGTQRGEAPRVGAEGATRRKEACPTLRAGVGEPGEGGMAVGKALWFGILTPSMTQNIDCWTWHPLM